MLKSAITALKEAHKRALNLYKLRRGRIADYLFLDLNGPLREKPLRLPWWHRYQPAPVRTPVDGHSLDELRETLKVVSSDPRVKGLIVDVTLLESGWANIQSLRSIFDQFKESDKKLVVYADDFNILNYYLASAADLIVMPPGSYWNVLGLAMSFSYLGEFLETLGLKPEVIAISPYKGAGDTYARTSMSDEQREMMSWILDAQYDTLVEGMSQGRNIPINSIKDLIDKIPYRAEQALEHKLIDEVAYLDQLANILSEEPVSLDTKPPRVAPLQQALANLIQPPKTVSSNKIAIVSVEGTIQYGSSRAIPSPIPLPFIGNQQAGSHTFAQAIRRAERDPKVSAIVCYINSPGGSALASDLMWRELERVRRRKPVVAYMGNVAASGGYYIAAGCDHIVAQPLTLTGSIGVLFMKLSSHDFYENMYIYKESLQRGQRARLYDTESSYTAEEKQVIEDTIRDSYVQFKDRVLNGRPLDDEHLEPVAGGRVWLGSQAAKHNLVDELGDLHSAIDKAKMLAGIDKDQETSHYWLRPSRKWRLPLPITAQGVRQPLKQLQESLSPVTRERLKFIMPFHFKQNSKP
ncbi:MAG TPA: signal peptide peptidase SppA [Gammaproteobacteria bacterium]|nr:signal peptide peptidase SppA [Gammaproteobacteria bacterium]